MFRKSAKKKWQPDTKVVSDIYNELRKQFYQGKKSALVNPIFSETEKNISGLVSVELPEKDFLHACAKVAAFLMDRDAVLNQLKKLNKLLLEKNKTNKDGVNILRDVLEKELKRVGFHPHFGKTH